MPLPSRFSSIATAFFADNDLEPEQGKYVQGLLHLDSRLSVLEIDHKTHTSAGQPGDIALRKLLSFAHLPDQLA
jgi:hypothetical protein